MTCNKYKIRITNLMDEQFTNDIILFKHIKNKKINKNRFFNELVTNMYLYYKQRREHLNKHLNSNLRKYIKDPNVIYNFSKDINNMALTLDMTDTDILPLDSEIYIYPTNETASIFNEIEVNELRNTTMSEFLRNLFSAYINMPLYTRESILFNDLFEILLDSINKENIIYIETEDDEFYMEPYYLTIHEKTSHTYLIGYKLNNNIKENFSIPVKDIYNVVTTNNKYNYSRNQLNDLSCLTSVGPEYINIPTVLIKVKFTEEGINRAEKLGISNMNIIQLDDKDTIVTFKSNIDQMFDFLVPFGKDASVIEPIALKTKLNEFYKEAANNS